MRYMPKEDCEERYSNSREIEVCEIARREGRISGRVHAEEDVPFYPESSDEITVEAHESMVSFKDTHRFQSEISDMLVSSDQEQHDELHEIFDVEYSDAFADEYDRRINS